MSAYDAKVQLVTIGITFPVALALALAHVCSCYLWQRLTELPRQLVMSLFGGITLSYVFLVSLPEISRAQARFESIGHFVFANDQEVYVFALLGLLVYQGAERLAHASRERRIKKRALYRWQHAVQTLRRTARVTSAWQRAHHLPDANTSTTTTQSSVAGSDAHPPPQESGSAVSASASQQSSVYFTPYGTPDQELATDLMQTEPTAAEPTTSDSDERNQLVPRRRSSVRSYGAVPTSDPDVTLNSLPSNHLEMTPSVEGLSRTSMGGLYFAPTTQVEMPRPEHGSNTAVATTSATPVASSLSDDDSNEHEDTATHHRGEYLLLGGDGGAKNSTRRQRLLSNTQWKTLNTMHLRHLEHTSATDPIEVHQAPPLTKYARLEDDRTETSVFALHMATFCVFGFLTGLVIPQRYRLNGTAELYAFGVAMLVHYIVNDSTLIEHHRTLYVRYGRFLGLSAILLGWLIGILLVVPELPVLLIRSFLAGAILVNTIKNQLPERNDCSFWALCLGAVLYGALAVFSSLL
ncbi:hypothetical protein CAOG_07733 [Capsaspora owczarzaki ATCC 30864]|uniref:Uncharacterized protein n=1 Tax=Capsaspora owczarzaki (strain ATCC 30864) TaxID=595528 RepID=A0A0D2WX39_CAPO3|nr:hypothetical protein CAOG_07733 [Capsaspora owczarzaki ATCC 30864]KJE97303.1 hypothetical protein CAOG_007733 [Capsaspora owczarzaki ATCC 30864]|eukprot:XP_004343607.1 hypothetical protein CAOG_07733 [Capsaspora owczarzaki ATCC 30864]